VNSEEIDRRPSVYEHVRIALVLFTSATSGHCDPSRGLALLLRQLQEHGKQGSDEGGIKMIR